MRPRETRTLGRAQPGAAPLTLAGTDSCARHGKPLRPTTRLKRGQTLAPMLQMR